MIAQDRLAQIIPEDLALANKALAASLLQITNISKTTLPRFAVAVSGVQTMYGLEQLNAQTSAIPESVVNYYQSQVAIQPTATNPTGDVTAGRTADRPFAVTTDIVNGGVECSGVSCGGNIPVCYPSSAISNTSVVGPPRGTPGVERGWAKLQTWGRGIAYSRFCTVLTTQPLSTEVALDDRVCGDMRPY